MRRVLLVTAGSKLRVSVPEVKELQVSIRDLREVFSYPNPDFWKKQRMGVWTGQTPRSISLVEREGDNLLLPRGVFSRLRAFLHRWDVAPVLVDRTVSGTGPTNLTWRAPGWDLGPDQRSAVRALLRRKQGILVGVCASGKTSVLLRVVAECGERTLVLVHTERILSDWVRAAEEHLGITPGVLYGKEKRESDQLVIGMVQSVRNRIKKDKRFASVFGCLILDEAHHCSAATFTEVVSAFPSRYRLAATATPKRKDGKEPLFYDVFGSEEVKDAKGRRSVAPRILFQITDADLDRYNRIMPVDVVVVPTKFDFDLNRERELKSLNWETLPKESAVASVKRYVKGLKKGNFRLNSYAEMLDAMVDDDQRLALILEYLLEEVRAKRTCLLLADRREMGLRLQSWLRRRGVEAGRLMGGKDAKEQEETARRLGEGSLSVAVGTTVADEGMNVKRLDRGFGLTPTASNPGRLVQQVGRFKRLLPGKESAVYFYFWDRRVSALKHHAREVFRAIPAPHRVWYAPTFGERVPLTLSLLRKLETEESL